MDSRIIIQPDVQHFMQWNDAVGNIYRDRYNDLRIPLFEFIVPTTTKTTTTKLSCSDDYYPCQHHHPELNRSFTLTEQLLDQSSQRCS